MSCQGIRKFHPWCSLQKISQYSIHWLVFCTLSSNSFLHLIYYKVVFFLAKIYMINCLLAVSLTVIDHCQQLHPSSFWLWYLKCSQPARKTTAGRANCTPFSPFSCLPVQPGDSVSAFQLSALVCSGAFHVQWVEFSLSWKKQLYFAFCSHSLK